MQPEVLHLVRELLNAQPLIFALLIVFIFILILPLAFVAWAITQFKESFSQITSTLHDLKDELSSKMGDIHQELEAFRIIMSTPQPSHKSNNDNLRRFS